MKGTEMPVTLTGGGLISTSKATFDVHLELNIWEFNGIYTRNVRLELLISTDLNILDHAQCFQE